MTKILTLEERITYLKEKSSFVSDAILAETKSLWVTMLLEAQQDIAFKAGIQEVVEWFKANQFDREHWENGSGYCSNGCPACKLDKQLKEWGINVKDSEEG